MGYSRNLLILLAGYPTKGGFAPEVSSTSDGFTSVNLGLQSGTAAELELRGGGGASADGIVGFVWRLWSLEKLGIH